MTKITYVYQTLIYLLQYLIFNSYTYTKLARPLFHDNFFSCLILINAVNLPQKTTDLVNQCQQVHRTVCRLYK